MNDVRQRELLQATIWKIANEVRGTVDGWDFKQFVLGTLFYRFISENFIDFVENGDQSVHYAARPDNYILIEQKEDITRNHSFSRSRSLQKTLEKLNMAI